MSRSRRGPLRRLHCQISQPQGKPVWVVHGEVFDAAVVLRRLSPSFDQWLGSTLPGEKLHQLWFPPSFANDFLVLCKIAEFLYKRTDYYAPEHVRSVRWDDSAIDIDWPLLSSVPPVLSDKDTDAPFLERTETCA